jgi:hypothetical protein
MSYAPNYNPVTGEYTPRKRRLPRRRVIPTSGLTTPRFDPMPEPEDFGKTEIPKFGRPTVRPVNRNAPLPPEFMPTIRMPRKIDKSGRGRKRTFEPSQADARDRNESKPSKGRPRGPQGPQGGSKKIGPSRPKPKSPPKQVRSTPRGPQGPQSKPKALPRRRAQAVKPKPAPRRGIARRRVIPRRR